MALPTATPFDGQVWPNDKPVITYNATLGQWVALHPVIPSRFVLTKYKGGSASDRTPQLGGTVIAAVREALQATRTLYVRTDGNDNNTGLSNDAGGAFLTLQAAYDFAAYGADANGYNTTLKMGNAGTFAGFVAYAPWLSDFIIVEGDTVTPSNTVVSTQIAVSDGAELYVYNLKLASSNNGLKTASKGIIHVGDGVEFGACTTAHMQCDNGFIYLESSYTISGGSTVHLNAFGGGMIRGSGITVTLTGTPNFSGAGFVQSVTGGLVYTPTITYVGAATGTRYTVGAGATINTNGGGASYYPGSIAGSGAGTYL